MSVTMIRRGCMETVGYPLLGPSLIFILTVCSFNFANNLQTLLALVLTVLCIVSEISKHFTYSFQIYLFKCEISTASHQHIYSPLE